MSASAWTGLPGTPGYLAGAAGTVTLPPGAILISVLAHASAAASIAIFGGQAIPLVAGMTWPLDLKHANLQAYGTGAQAQIVFTGTDSYFVHWVRMGNT